MCEPTTIAYIAVARAAPRAYVAADSQKKSANYQSEVAANNAKTSEMMAQDALRRGEQDKISTRRKYDQLAGAQRVKMASRGLDLTTGSAQSILEDTNFFSESDQATVMDNANREAWGMRVQGSNQSAAAGLYGAQANGISPLFNATVAGFGAYSGQSSLLTNSSAVAGKWYGRGNNPSANGYTYG